MMCRLPVSLLLAVFLFGWTFPAVVRSLDYTDFDLDELMQMDIVYGASTYEQDLVQAPSAVLVITADEIEAYGYRTLADLLDTVAGYFTTDDRNCRYVGIRGFNRPGDYGTRLLVLVDGHRINDNLYQSSTAGREFPVPLEAIRRIEIVRGPSASLYGTGAFFGVLNIVTRGGLDLDGAEISVEAGSHETFAGSLAWGGKLPTGCDITVTGAWYQSAGRDFHFPEFDGVFKDGDRERAAHVHLRLDRGPLAVRAVHAWREKRIPTAPWGTVFDDNGTRAVDERSYMSAAWRLETGDQADLTLQASYDRYAYEGFYRYEDDEGSVYTNHDLGLGRWLGLKARWTSRLGSRHRLVAGAEFRGHLRCEQRNHDEGESDDPHFESDEPSQEFGLSLQDEIALGRGLIANLGIRHDRYKRFDATSPRLGLIWEAGRGTVLKALYGEAFRAPNAYELHYHDGYETQKDNPDLAPETIRSWELVLHRDMGPRLRGMVSVFQYRIDDLVTQTIDPVDGLLVFRNSDSIDAAGFEAALDGRMLRGVRGRASYSYQHSEDRRTGALLTNSPRHMARLNVLIPLFGPRATAGLMARYNSERLTLTRQKTGDVLWMGLSLRARPWGDRLTLGAAVDNLLDADHGDPGSGEHVQDVIPRAGRIYRVTATVLW